MPMLLLQQRKNLACIRGWSPPALTLLAGAVFQPYSFLAAASQYAVANPKREKRERRAARRTRKLAKRMVTQRRRERAAKAMAELDAEKAQ